VECISHVFTDMAKLGDAANHPSSCPKNTIQGLQSDLKEATIERRTMVDAIDYEGMDLGGSRRRGKRAGDHLQLAQVVEARAIESAQ